MAGLSSMPDLSQSTGLHPILSNVDAASQCRLCLASLAQDTEAVA